MKVQIRNEVFETNSSSMHSIAIMKRSEHFTQEEIKQDFWLLDNHETGEKKCVWDIDEDELVFTRDPLRFLWTFKDKWLYACATLVNDYNDETCKELVGLALKYVPGLKKIEFPMTIESVYNKDNPTFSGDEYIQTNGKTKMEFLEYLHKKEKEYGMELEHWSAESYEYERVDDDSDNVEHFVMRKPFTGMVDDDILTGFLKNENISLEDFLTNKKYMVIQDGDEYCAYRKVKSSGIINLDAIEREYCLNQW